MKIEIGFLTKIKRYLIYISPYSLKAYIAFSQNKSCLLVNVEENVKVSFAGEYAPKLKNEFYISNDPSRWDQES